MKKIFCLVILVFALCACNSDVPQLEFAFKKYPNLFIELDDYYLLEDSNVPLEEFNKNVSEIMENHNTKVSTISHEQFRELFQHSVKSARVNCSCCGQVSHMEVVDEGGGCFGIVRQYANGSASISAYCNGGATYQGYFCYASN